MLKEKHGLPLKVETLYSQVVNTATCTGLLSHHKLANHVLYTSPCSEVLQDFVRFLQMNGMCNRIRCVFVTVVKQNAFMTSFGEIYEQSPFTRIIYNIQFIYLPRNITAVKQKAIVDKVRDEIFITVSVPRK
jgi:hypothetical protein